MQVLDQEEDFGPRVPATLRRNGSLACGIPIPLLLLDSCSRSSFSYDKLPQEPINLSVLKLDGSSFDIEVMKTAKVAELKHAVEAAFNHLPRDGFGKVSWSHVWGQFCLCYDGQKLLCDIDFIGSYGIKDGDELQFVRHASINYNFIRSRSDKDDTESEQPRMSICRFNSHGEKHKHGRVDSCSSTQENLSSQHNYDDEDDGGGGDNYDEDKYVTIRCQYRMAHVLRAWFSYRRLSGSRRSFEEKNSPNSPKLASSFFRGFRRLHGSKHYYRTETWKGN